MTSSTTIMEVRLANWSGQIPVVLELSPSCLSSPTMPPPIHIMVSRQSYLHVALESAVRRLYQFAAPIMISSSFLRAKEPMPGENDDDDNDDDDDRNEESKEQTTKTKTENENNVQQETKNYPICWFEDEENQMPLRWHLFAGCLYDMMHSASQNTLPWKIRLQFGGNYPAGILLPLADPVLESVERYYRNQLKQALCLETGSTKVALQGLTKQSHEQIWNSICSSNSNTNNGGVLYHQVNQIHDSLFAKDYNNNDNDDDTSNELQRLPIRVLLDYSQPPLQPPISNTGKTTLGKILIEACPSLFQQSEEEKEAEAITVTSKATTWTIQGISEIPLSTPLLLLWQTLCHPDHFLYILVRSSKNAE